MLKNNKYKRFDFINLKKKNAKTLFNRILNTS